MSRYCLIPSNYELTAWGAAKRLPGARRAHPMSPCRPWPGYYVCETPQEVAVWLWGRELCCWIVCDGECPYRFLTGDLEVIQGTLEHYPAPYVRRCLPLSITTEAMLRRGIGLGYLSPKGTVCVIGDGPWPSWEDR